VRASARHHAVTAIGASVPVASSVIDDEYLPVASSKDLVVT
jgi:hypothetical protein